MLIRKAQPADMDELQLLFASVRAAAGWLPAPARTQADLAQETSGESLFLARDDHGRLLGFISIQSADPFIHHLYVADHARRSGVASALLASLQSHLPLPWKLKCLLANRGALAFYDSQGWHAVGDGCAADGPYVLLMLT